MTTPKNRDPLSVFVGCVLATARVSRGMTQTDVGERLYVSGATICYHEKGHSQLHLRQFIDHCAILDIDPAAVIGMALDAGAHSIGSFRQELE